MARRKARRTLKITLLVLLALGLGGFWLVQRWSATPHGRLDPRVAVFLKLTELRGGRAAETDLSIAESRRRLAKKAAAVAGRPAAMAEVRDLVAQSGDLRVPVRVYAPEAGKLLPVLIYPALDAAHLDTPSYGMFGEGYGLDRTNVDRYIALYLPEPKDRITPYASPLLADDLAGLPPALVITAGFDVLRDEGEAYARKLQAAGTAASVIRYPGMIHGFVNADRLLPQARRATDEIGAAIRGVFAEGNAEK